MLSNDLNKRVRPASSLHEGSGSGRNVKRGRCAPGMAPVAATITAVALCALMLGCSSTGADEAVPAARHGETGEWDLAQPNLAATRETTEERRAEPFRARLDDRDDDAWLTQPPRPRTRDGDAPPERDRRDPTAKLEPLPALGEWDIDDWALGESVGISGADRTILLGIAGNRAVTDATLREAAADALKDLAELPAPRLAELEREPRRAALEGYHRQIRAITDDAAHLMQRHYESVGYYWARTSVEWHIDEGDPRLVAVTFRVLREEPRVRLESVEFYGVDAFDPAGLRDLFGTPDAILFGQTFYVESTVEQARNDMLAMYRQAGYLRAQIRVHEPRTEAQWSWSPGRSTDLPPDRARVIVEVNEGRLYRLSEIRLRLPGYEGVAPLPPKLEEALARFLGEPYRRNDHVLILAEVKEFYQDRGYAHVHIGEEETDIDDSRGQVTLTVRVDPGRVYTVGEITVEAESLSESFLRRIMPLRSGEVYRISEVRAAYRQLMRTEIVRTPRIEIVHTEEASGSVDLAVTLEEMPSVELSPYVGWGSYEQLRGSLKLSEHNLFSAARVLSMEVGASLKSEWAEITFSDPWTLGGDWPYSVSGFYLRRDDPDFSRQEVGLKVSLRHAFSPQFDVGLFYQYVDSRAFNLDDPLIDTRDFEAKLGTLSLRAQFATVADRLSPVAGMVHTLNMSLSAEALGSTVDFSHIRLQSVFYVPIDRESRLVLALRYLGEVNLPLGDTEAEEIPVQERIYNGGATSVRSFGQHGLRRFGDPGAIGGQGRNVATAEVRFPLLMEAGLDGALFADAGNLAASLPGFFNHWSFAFGFGLRYVTPVGPARLDVAWSPMPRHDEERWHLHFWIGFPF